MNGITGQLLVLGDAGYKYTLAMDYGGNLGVVGSLNATTLTLNPTATSTGITVNATTNASVTIGDGTNYCQMALCEIGGNYFSDAAVGDGILRSFSNIRIGKAGAGVASAMVIGANIVDFPGAGTITAAPPTGSSNSGWKMTFWGNTYAVGVASNTLAFKCGYWLSVFAAATNPAGGATTTVPDANAAATIGTDGSFRGTTYYAGGTTGSTAGPFTSITSITAKGGLVTGLAGSSDERLKTIERPYEGGLEAVLKINPVYFHWNEEGAKYTGLPGDRIYLGFTAQDAQRAIPECVPGTEGDNYLSFDERPIIAALCDAVKTLAARVKELEEKLK